MKEIKLGSIARDTISGFQGVVVAKTQWLQGCERITIQPKTLDKDGQPQRTVTFDIGQIELVEEKPEQAPKKTGGPGPEPSRW